MTSVRRRAALASARFADWLRRTTEFLRQVGRTFGGPVLVVWDDQNGMPSPRTLRQPVLRGALQSHFRRHCLAVPIASDVVLCRVLGRYKMYVEASDYGHAVHLMMDGYWEMPLTQVLAGLVRPGMATIDVGANQGYFTLLLASLVGAGGSVDAVEPNPRMVGLLRRSVIANGFAPYVRIHQLAAGGPSGARVVLRVPEGTPSGAYLEAVPPGEDGSEAVTLDALMGDRPVDLMKIDAEGFEMPIWAGMRAILARDAPLIVVMEFILDRCPTASAFFAEARSLGFSLSHVVPGLGLAPVAAETILAADSASEWILVLERGYSAAQ